MSDSNDLIQLLSERIKSPVLPVQVQLEPEGGFKLRRRERKPRLQPNGRLAVVSNRPRKERFKPSAEMLNVRNDIEQARLRAARAYNRLLPTCKGMPDFLLPDLGSLKEFQELVRKVTLLENKYKDMEVAVCQERQARHEVEMQRVRVSEYDGYLVNWYSISIGLGGLDEERAFQREVSGFRKNKLRKLRREKRELWRQMRIAPRINDLSEKAKDALAEGLMKLGEFRSFMEALDTDPLEASADALAAGIISLDEYQDLKTTANL